MQGKVVPCLWFDGAAAEAAKFYAATFPDAEVTGESPPMVWLRVADLDLRLLDGGPEFEVDGSMSFFHECRTRAEIDSLFQALSEGGTVLMELGEYPFAQRYGWVADRFGVHWQLILRAGEGRRRAFPSLMFSGAVCGRAEEAIRFYEKLWTEAGMPAAVGTLSRYGPGKEPDVERSLEYAEFTLGASRFSAMDSARVEGFKFTEGESLVVSCGTQGEIDYFWNRLSEGGSEGWCGWLVDRFGLSWQVIPEALGELMAEPARARKVTEAFMKMRKFDLEALRRA
jgi:predicted 3-demethylubiquinone-9 3-methyltransferase (glyoxalase superfamily)